MNYNELLTKINKLETIFEEYNIFKSVFVCNIENIDTYFSVLSQHDFPVSKLDNLTSYNHHQSRILLLDERSFEHFDLIKNEINVPDINMVIYLDDISPLKYSPLDNVPKFILS